MFAVVHLEDLARDDRLEGGVGVVELGQRVLASLRASRNTDDDDDDDDGGDVDDSDDDDDDDDDDFI